MVYSKASGGRFGKQDAQSLKSLAMSSVGVKNTYISIQITQTIAQIELIESRLAELETVIEAAVDELDSVIMTVPGIGKLNGTMILGEIGDIKLFSDPSKLLAYAGLNMRIITIIISSAGRNVNTGGTFIILLPAEMLSPQYLC